MLGIVEKIPLWEKRRAVISYDENADSPRDCRDNDLIKICFRENRNYRLPNDLNIPFEYEEATMILDGADKEYHIFVLDWYEHSGIVISLSGEGMQCNFDTSKWCWVICIRKEYLDKKYSKEEAEEIARDCIKEYTAYMNGEVYQYYIEEIVERTNGDRKLITWEEVEDTRIGGFYWIEETKNYIAMEQGEI